MKKAAGDEKEEDIQMTQGIVQKLVTADGTYASQSAFSALLPVKKDQVRSDIYTLLFYICATLHYISECFLQNYNYFYHHFNKKITVLSILILFDWFLLICT